MSAQFNQGKTMKIIVEGIGRGDVASETWCKNLLTHLCKLINMNPISGPYSTRFMDIKGDISKDGVSAFLMIAESHIAIHTWSNYCAARIVVDSCADFDENVLVEEISRRLEPKLVSTFFV